MPLIVLISLSVVVHWFKVVLQFWNVHNPLGTQSDLGTQTGYKPPKDL